MDSNSLGETHGAFMEAALAEAAAALAEGEVPIGAVLVRGGKLLARAHNRREALKDPTAHAEILAIRQAALDLGRWRLSDCALYVTLEPCPMCAGAIVAARIPLVVYGAGDPRAGAAGSVLDVLHERKLNHHPEVIAGVREEACKELLRQFFSARRESGVPSSMVTTS